MEEFGSIILDNKNEEVDYWHANIRMKIFGHILQEGRLFIFTYCMSFKSLL